MNFDNSRILFLLEKGLNEAIAEAANRAKNRYVELLAERKSSYYDRTGDIERALNNPPYIKIVGGKTVKINIYDEKYIKAATAQKRGFFNHHQSFSGKSSVSNVVAYQEDGFSINGKEVPGMKFSNRAFLEKDWDDYIIDRSLELIIDDLYYEIDKIAKGGGV